MIAGVTLAVVVGLIVLVLFVPFDVSLEGSLGEEAVWGVGDLRWGRGLARYRVGPANEGRLFLLGVPVARSARPFSSGSRARRRAREGGRGDAGGRRRSRRPGALRLLDQRHTLVGMAGRALRGLHADLEVHGSLGLGDPADTARALAVARAIDRRAPGRVTLDLHDDFLEDTTQLSGRFRAWVMPAEVLFIAATWMVRADTRRVLRAL